ncbi:MAG: KH domain-containing protein [Clostridia bacterium]|nr:KH domain-containing protein [Clostridia bacterium]MBQ2940369.1 KH domain-containing protein [Clostridia bacterium]
MKELLELIARGLVDQPDAVVVEQDEPTDDGLVVLHLHVAEGDMGRVIGKQGRIAKAMRTVMRAAATRQDVRVSVEID